MIKVGIVGGTGYTGVELMRLLALHPQVSIEVITSRANAGAAVADLFPNLRGHIDLCFSEPDLEVFRDCDLVFFATPNTTAMKQARALTAAGIRIIDLAADFRIKDIATWEQWYGASHACPDIVDRAVYGLPELNREAIRTAEVVANPGCYPTSVILALLPLLKRGRIDPATIIADCKSGTSGAGRQANVATGFCEVTESFKAYAVSGHRHLPEIRQILQSVDPAANVVFIPHLLPIIRGIHATVYATARGPAEDMQVLFEDYYETEPFVDVLPQGSHPETRTVK
ncbi:MAG: N-acetyl-gamma-glutamyl-phosphate reductase, partial [Gammaproteobacteria bacterium]|nr:N-acetyl-gamma-glutamyl-phosphate reductase [Gammaproteobacteria bacterium]